MARSDYTTPDLLTEWRKYSAQNAWKFNQVSAGEPVPHDKYLIWIQSERDIIARGLQSAYDTMTVNLNYSVSPQYYVNEWAWVPNKHRALSHQLLYTNKAHLQAFGTRTTTLIEAGATISYSGSPTSTATATVTTTVDADEIQAFFTVSDGAPNVANAKWRIPATVTKSGGVATITMNRFDCVLPSIWANPYTAPNYENDGRNGANNNDNSDFVTSVDVYRVYTDSTDAVQVYTFATQQNAPTFTSVTANIVDGTTGEFTVSGTGSNQCALLRVSYLAGYPLDASTGGIDTELAQALTRLANVNMALVPMSVTKEPLVNRVWLTDRDPDGNDITQDMSLGLMYVSEVVARRKHYIGGYGA